MEPNKGVRVGVPIYRFYYDKPSGECKTFLYGGEGGNKNNFAMQKECMETCHGK